MSAPAANQRRRAPAFARVAAWVRRGAAVMVLAKRVWVDLPQGRVRVRVPPCDACGAQPWCSEDGRQLVCRSCGRTGALRAVDSAPAAP